MTTCAACGLCMMVILPITATIVIGVCCLCFQVSISPSFDENLPTECFGGGDAVLTPSIKVKAY